MNYIADIGDQFFGQGMRGSNINTFKSLTGIGNLVSLFINISFVIAGLILLFYFIMGGIGMISSAGKSDPQKAEQAKKSITSALVGFIVVFVAYWIVQLLGQILGFDQDPLLKNLLGL